MIENKSLRNKLIEHKLVTAEQMDRVEEEARKTGLTFLQALLNSGLVAEEDLARLRAEELGVPFMDLAGYLIDPEVLKLVPEVFARRYKLIPLFRIADSLTVAMFNPQDIIAIDEVRRISRLAVIDPVLATEKAIVAAIDRYYRVETGAGDVGREGAQEKPPGAREGTGPVTDAGEGPVIKLVDRLITRAVKDGASDVHIEPAEKDLRIRYRLDGILHEANILSREMENEIISRIKVMARLNIAEKRIPQDGRLNLKMENRDIDLRVSTFPTIYGENVVLRILDKTRIIFQLDQLGFSPDMLENYRRIIAQPYGIILVTGPTGCGKTTTLYATLSAINSPEKNIITIEDPIEYQLPLIRQSQINPKAGLTFANGLRSILRQDPDVVMVGEIRDLETAQIAIQAAMTGHLVLSTLHTNDASSALTRLEDMGIEPYLISSSVTGVLAQRLVRVLCQKCKEEFVPEEKTLASIGAGGRKDVRLYRRGGCRDCRDTGYKGRTAVFELLVVEEEIKKLIMNRAPANKIRDKAVELGMKTLREAGQEKVLAGITAVEEVLKTT